MSRPAPRRTPRPPRASRPPVVLEGPTTLIPCVGGKGWFTAPSPSSEVGSPARLDRFVEPGCFGRYIEPCVGGGAVFRWLAQHGYLDEVESLLSDVDVGLARLWAAVRDEPEALADALDVQEAEAALVGGRKLFFLERDLYNVQGPHDAGLAQILWMRYATFNAVWRHSTDGRLTVGPRASSAFATRRTPTLERLQRLAYFMRRTSVVAWSVFDLDDLEIGYGDFIFLDPPYDGGFVAYGPRGFTREDQERLLEQAAAWARAGARVLYMNANTPLIRDLAAKCWPEAYQEVLRAPRKVAGAALGRAAASELLLSSHPPHPPTPSTPTPHGGSR